jgi:aminodeoxyfutalosine deaminase
VTLHQPENTVPTNQWIAGLPKVELHLHLEGSMSPTTVGVLAQRHQADTGEVWPGGLPEQFSFDDFPDFARQFIFGLKLIRTGEDLETIVVALAKQLARDNVRYAEVTTTAFTHLTSGMAPADYGQALTNGRRRASKEHGVELAWVIDIPRDLEWADSTVTTDFLASNHAPDGLIGIGLGGYEVGFPPEPYEAAFAKGRALGLHSVPHAGETEGPASIIGALDHLHAERIGHGVRCLEDSELVARIRDTGTTLEVCPTSNVLLNVCSTIEEHPIRQLIDAGLRLTINTDDPGMFATNLTTELLLIHQHHHVPLEDLRLLQLTALNVSFAPPEVRRRITDELHTYEPARKGSIE